MFTATGQCAEPILPLYELCHCHLWGYISHSAIVLVKTLCLCHDTLKIRIAKYHGKQYFWENKVKLSNNKTNMQTLKFLSEPEIEPGTNDTAV